MATVGVKGLTLAYEMNL